MIVKTEAVVLKKMKFSESSLILHLYTREFGKISVIAKGARDQKSKLRSILQPLNYVSVVIYKKENRDLHLVSQCDIVRSMKHLCESIEKMSAAMTVIELTSAISHAEEENVPLFTALVDTLSAINDATKNETTPLYFFEMKLLGLLGFAPEFNQCSHCGALIDAKFIHEIRDGFTVGLNGIFCGDCASHTLSHGSISKGTVRILQKLQDAPSAEDVVNLGISEMMGKEVASTLRHYLFSHVENIRGLKSEGVFAQMNAESFK